MAFAIGGFTQFTDLQPRLVKYKTGLPEFLQQIQHFARLFRNAM